MQLTRNWFKLRKRPMRSASNALKHPQHQVRKHRLLPLHLRLHLLQRLRLLLHLWLHLWLRLWQHANLRLHLRLWLHLHLHRQLRHLLRLQGSPGRWAFSRAW